jgi:hypothetical protein
MVVKPPDGMESGCNERPFHAYTQIRARDIVCAGAWCALQGGTGSNSRIEAQFSGSRMQVQLRRKLSGSFARMNDQESAYVYKTE